MGVISATDYRSLATYYTSAQTQIAGVSQYYYNASYLILALNSFDPEIDLLVPFHNAYLSAETAYSRAPQAAINAVRSLQNHVLKRAEDGSGNSFTDINDWFAYEGTFTDQLSEEFATLSEQAGFRIEDGSVGDTGDYVAQALNENKGQYCS